MKSTHIPVFGGRRGRIKVCRVKSSGRQEGKARQPRQEASAAPRDPLRERSRCRGSIVGPRAAEPPAHIGDVMLVKSVRDQREKLSDSSRQPRLG